MLRTLHYRIHEVSHYVNWLYFFHAWGFPARFAAVAGVHACEACRARWLTSFAPEERPRAAEAMHLLADARRTLDVLDADCAVHVRFGLFECNSDGDDVVGDGFRLAFLRQQGGECLCLADFVRPLNPQGLRDRIGVFAATADAAIEHRHEAGSPDADEYRHLLCQTLADRLAEAATERAHEEIRRTHWGYAPDERLNMADLHAERFRGIRPAVGYPSLPDQSINFDLDKLIDFADIGIRLTENGAMMPHASVSGLMFAHPEARYFAVGSIGEDQLADYAQRKRRTPEEMRRFLAANLKG